MAETSASQDTTPPTTLQAVAAEQAMHIPGGFPAETPSEDVNDPTAFPGDGRHGLTEIVPLTDSKTDGIPSTSVPDGTTPAEPTIGSPPPPAEGALNTESSQPGSLPPTDLPSTLTEQKTDEAQQDSSGDTALAGAGAAAAVGAGGYGVYSAARVDDKPSETTASNNLVDDKTTPAIDQQATTESATAEPVITQAATAEPTKTETPATVPVATKSEEDDHTARNAAIAGGAGAATGAAGYGIYEATKSDDSPQTISNDPAGKSSVIQNQAPENEEKKSTFQKLKEKLKGDRSKDESEHPTNTSLATENPKPGMSAESEDHTTRNAALVGGGAAAAGGVGYGVYESTKDDDQAQAELAKQQEQQRQQAEQMRKEQEKQAEKAKKEQEQAAKEREKEAEKAKKEQERAAKEREKEAEKAKKEQEKAEKQREKDAKNAQKEREQQEEKDRKEREKAAIAAQKAREERAEKERKEQAALEAKRVQDEEAERKRLAEEEERKTREEDDSYLGRDAAVIGGGVTAGAAGATYLATRDDHDNSKTDADLVQEQPTDGRKEGVMDKLKGVFSSDKQGGETKAVLEDKPKEDSTGAAPIERSTAAPAPITQPAQQEPALVTRPAEQEYASATSPEGSSTLAGVGTVAEASRADDGSHDFEDPNLSAAERLHKYEAFRAEHGLIQEKKPHLVSRLLHHNKSEPEHDSSTTPARADEQHQGLD